MLGVLDGEVMSCETCADFGAVLFSLVKDQSELLMESSEGEDDDFGEPNKDLVVAAKNYTKNGTLPYAQFQDEYIAGWTWEIYHRRVNTRSL